MSDVFISYARSTAGQAQRVAQALRAAGYGVWLDDEIPAHRSFAEVIEERLTAARAVVVLWSADAVKSEWVRSEANRAREAGKLVQMAVEDIALPMPFDTLECAKLINWKGDTSELGWTKVAAGVAALVGGEVRASVSAKSTRRGRGPAIMAAMAAVALLLAAIGGAVVWRASQKPPPLSLRTVAVLPVRNLSGDPALDLVADAVTSDTTDLLGRVGFHKTPPLTQTMATRGQPLDDLAKGRTLKVRFLVTASLRKASPGLRLSYQILDTIDGQVVTAADLVNTAPDTGLAERRLALKLFYAVGSALIPKWLDDQMARPPNDADPENVLARLRQIHNTLGRKDVATAQRLITAADAIPATSDLKPTLDLESCFTYLAMMQAGYAASPAQRATWAQAALDGGARAAARLPNASSPHDCRAYVFIAQERWDEAAAEGRHIIEAIPNASNGYEDLANVAFDRGQFADAVQDFTEVAARHENGAPYSLGLSNLFLGDYAAALDSLREAAVQDPTNAAAALFTVAALELSGQHAQALSQAQAYRGLKSDGSEWRVLSESHEAAFVAAAARVRGALKAAGLEG